MAPERMDDNSHTDTVMNTKGFTHTIKYGRFKEVTIESPVNWSMNPFQVLNWRHNLLSLRWLTKSIPLKKRHLVLMDFFEFHYKNKNQNDMIGTRLGDHTTSIRLSHIDKMIDDFDLAGETEAVALCKELMIADVNTLLSAEVYRHGHNHGVMADTAILESSERLGYLDDEKLRSVAIRGAKSLASIFDSEGVTQEHSISYQEYNYPVAIKFLNASEKYKEQISQVPTQGLPEACKEILSFFTRSNGEYFPVGDSFRLPNKNIRSDHPEIDSAPQSVHVDGSTPKSYFKNGFFAYINTIEGKRFHFTSCCSWNSSHHKQDDDLSFCLELDGDLIFDDPGYSDQADRVTNDYLRSSCHHSVVTISGKPYLPRNKTNHKSLFKKSSVDSSGFILSGSHQRIPGVKVSRDFVLSGKKLTITDEVISEAKEQVEHGFVLSPLIEVRIRNSALFLYKGYRLIGSLECDSTHGEWAISRINYIPANRSEISHTMRVIFRSHGDTKTTFKFTIS
ncbi:heparinase II/III domain-containing protein [Pseudomonas putida]|uniref:Heparinase II/III-like C-terminal domain-containing protein n=1 Tax=Pseudomonas putida (strain DOT-T1E) TaxID=1196325 RepID=I7B7C7_PSEPT|nr:heparinase II/III family protein [Pseudomonas putida]AFO47238.1 hypothetical protein T1E_1383 [Pseudomonas putida DOT-T1E]UZM95197.1 heparinase II/III-family protein [Pseudomonas putida DOT-T1E]